MKVLVFVNELSLGGTEKAACRWACGLRRHGHELAVATLADGPRRAELDSSKIPVHIVRQQASELAELLRHVRPEVIHAHVSGYPQPGDVLGAALKLLPKRIPVVQTNVFGLYKNPPEAQWTDFRLFISWTSCVQAARRIFRRLDENFFRQASVVVYPLDPLEPTAATAVAAFRQKHGVGENEVLFGRLGRPDPHKWTGLAVDAFRAALRRHPNLKLLLREPPPEVAEKLRTSPDGGRFVLLPVTADPAELRLTMSALDVVLHTSSMGESFGYGIAEPMNLGKPVISHTLPWRDQAQIELVRHGEGGFIAGTPAAMAAAIVRLAEDASLRQKMGAQAQTHIRALADPEISTRRLATLLQAVIEGCPNPFAPGDLVRARTAAHYLDQHQFGHSLLENLALRPFHYRVRFHQFRKRFLAKP